MAMEKETTMEKEIIMENPLLEDSALPYGAPQFDRIRNEHYVPAFRKALSRARAEIDGIAESEEEPTFENTVEAMERAGRTLGRVAATFYNLNEADTNEGMEAIAEEISPMMTEWSMYVSLNPRLFARVKAVRDDALRRGEITEGPKRGDLTRHSEGAGSMEQDRRKLLENTYRSFVRNGANLSDEDKKVFAALSEELDLMCLQFQKNVLAATNSFVLQLTDEADLEGLPDHLRNSAAHEAGERGLEGWVFTLQAPSYRPFMRFSRRRDLRRRMYTAQNTRATGGENDNVGTVARIVELRRRIAGLLGYETYADYALEERMAGTPAAVLGFLDELLRPSLPVAREEVAKVRDYAMAHGFAREAEAEKDGTELMPWDFDFWAERYKEAHFSLNEEELKPYFRLESCIDAVFDLADRLYGITFEPRSDIPVYHPDVRVYDVKDSDGSHLALFYADFFPRESKRGGAWMTEFRGQSVRDGVEERPLISIVTNFTKPAGGEPSLLSHDELTTLLHEFGHALHGILAKGRYESLTGTNVVRDFVELPSQIMENWAFEPQWLDSFARHYRTGEVIPDELVARIASARNFLSAYYHVRQLRFGILDMAFHTLPAALESAVDPLEMEREALKDCAVLPDVPGCAIAPAFGHIFSGGYAAGYYSYKWAEVLEADAFSLFRERGIFDRGTARSFRRNILEKGGSEDAAVLYRRFRGHDPQPEALLEKLGIKVDQA